MRPSRLPRVRGIGKSIRFIRRVREAGVVSWFLLSVDSRRASSTYVMLIYDNNPMCRSDYQTRSSGSKSGASVAGRLQDDRHQQKTPALLRARGFGVWPGGNLLSRAQCTLSSAQTRFTV